MSYQSKFTGAEIDAGIDAANAALPKNGGTMIGALILAGDPADDKGAVTKKYVDDAVKNIASTPGNDGEDGVSPTISVTEITGGHRITITDANGTQSFDIMNGKDGADGSGGDGSGDMLKAVYDADNDGTVDNAAKLGGKAASEYYGKENPPPYPVTSVNGMTGDVEIPTSSGSVDVSELVNIIYPVGSIYTSVNAASPATLFGGEWEQIKGRFLIGTGAPDANSDGTSPGNYNYIADTMGGEAEHTLTEDEMPNHSHKLNIYVTGTGGSSGGGQSSFANTRSGTNYNAIALGGDQPHNNMPPYLAVYMWKRTA